MQNLLERFEKHMKKSKGTIRKSDKAALGSLETLQADGKQAIENLDEICVYMLDYQAIVDEFLEQERQFRRQQMHSLATGTSPAQLAAIDE